MSEEKSGDTPERNSADETPDEKQKPRQSGPVFTEVTKAALATLGVPPSGSPPADIPTVPETP